MLPKDGKILKAFKVIAVAKKKKKKSSRPILPALGVLVSTTVLFFY